MNVLVTSMLPSEKIHLHNLTSFDFNVHLDFIRSLNLLSKDQKRQALALTTSMAFYEAIIEANKRCSLIQREQCRRPGRVHRQAVRFTCNSVTLTEGFW